MPEQDKQQQEAKAILTPISEDGDPFEIGDVVAFSAWDGQPTVNGTMVAGEAYLGIIRAINGGDASVEYLDTNMQPTGNSVSRPLSALREYMPPGVGSDTDSGTPATEPGESADMMDMKALDTDIEVDHPLTAVKAIGDDGWRVGGYLVVFTDESRKDLTGEYFTAKTDFALDLYDKRPALYHHGLDAAVKTAAVGVIDNLHTDDVGIWAEAQLNKRNKYAAKVKELVEKGALGWSSGSIAHLVKKTTKGEITHWPIVEGSLTPTPAMPYGTDIASMKSHLWEPRPIIQAYKALNLTIPQSLFPAQDKTAETRQHSESGSHAPAAPTAVKAITIMNGVNTMEITMEQLNAFVELSKKAQAQSDAKPEVKVEPADPKAVEAAIKAEAERQIKAQLSEAAKSLPTPAAENKPKIEVVSGDPRFAGYSAADMAFYAGVMANIATQSLVKSSDLGNQARSFLAGINSDPEHRFARELSAKAFRENAQNRLPGEALAYLPFKSADAANANDYNPVAFKANELDNTAQTGYGIEWVPTVWSPDIWRKVRISNPVAANMQRIDMPSNPYNIPTMGADPTVYYAAEGTDLTQLVLTSANTVTASKVASGKAQLSAKKLAIRVGFSTELVEDSIIPIIPMYREQTVRQLLNYIDDTIINGDTATGANTNVNLIDATPTAGTAYLAFDGLRKYALVTNTTQAIDNAGAPTLAQFRKARFTLNKQYAVDINNLFWIVDVGTYAKMLNMPEFLTWQQLGMAGSNAAGLLPGGSPDTVADAPMPVGMIDGVKVYVSAQISLANTAGKISNTGGNNVTGTAIIYHRTRWYLGYRRDVQLETFGLPYFSDTYQMLAYVRVGLQSFDTASAALLYDLTV